MSILTIDLLISIIPLLKKTMHRDKKDFTIVDSQNTNNCIFGHVLSRTSIFLSHFDKIIRRRCVNQAKQKTNDKITDFVFYVVFANLSFPKYL